MDRTIVLRSFFIGVALTALVYFLSGKQAAFAVAIGALIAGANFRLASGMLRKIVVPGANPTTATAKGIISFVFRYTLVGVVLLAAVKAGVQPMFLMVGVSALVLAVLSGTLTLLKGARENI